MPDQTVRLGLPARQSASRRRARRVVVGGVTALAVLACAAGAWAATRSADSPYRTVTATVGDVDQVLALTGTVSTVSRADASFAVGGTVSAVAVEVGDHVSRGQVLARLDRAPLQAAVRRAQADLLEAQVTLQESENADTATTTAASTTVAATTAAVATSTVTVASKPAPAGVAALTAAMMRAQQSLSAAQDAAAAALDQTRAACSPAVPATSPPTPEPSSSSPATHEPPDVAAEDAPADAAGTACSAALATLSTALTAQDTAQAAVSAAQGALLTAVRDQSVAGGAAGAGGTGETGGEGAAAPTGSDGDAATGSGSPSGTQGDAQGGTSGGSAGGQASNGDPEAAVLTAQIALTEAKADLADALLRSPVAGTVAAVPWVVGDAVSTSDVVPVVGSGAVEVSVEVPIESLPLVQKGQLVTVAGVGTAAGSTGAVSAVGLAPTSGASTSTYPVTVLVPEPSPALRDGASASAAIHVRTATDVVVVPPSAVTSVGTDAGAMVSVVGPNGMTRRQVEIGAIDATGVEISSGLDAGALVVVADMTTPLPSADSVGTRMRTVIGGGPGVGGAIPGGAPR